MRTYKDYLKRAACAVIDENEQMIVDFGQDILKNPELGYKELRTSQKVMEAFHRLGINRVDRPAKTGVKGWLLQNKGPRVAIIGEMDAVISLAHPYADKTTGAAHACGHNAQLAAMIGCALGLQAVQQHLRGGVCLMAAPAEEYIEIGWRSVLHKSGELKYLGGKQQLIAEGAFDDIDIAMMVHSESDAPCPRVVVSGNANGLVGKELCFVGKEAHAGGAPWDGVNALNAATLAIAAIHANRETFKDTDRIRVHPIITKGGEIVNTVPAEVTMECYVRAISVEAMKEANAKVNRAFNGAAYAIGAQVKINDLPGYLPMTQNETLSMLFAENVKLLMPELCVEHGLTFCGSTDMGDLSYLMPIIQPTISGFCGAIHSKHFEITDKNLAYIVPAKVMAATVIDLLAVDNTVARQLTGSNLRHTKEEYDFLWKSIIKHSENCNNKLNTYVE